jgi:hypothetical protein
MGMSINDRVRFEERLTIICAETDPLLLLPE